MNDEVKKLIIDIPFAQAINIVMAFSLETLGDLNNLDETWDEHLMPIIQHFFDSRHIHVKHSNVKIIPTTMHSKAKLSYELLLICTPPALDLNALLHEIVKHNFHRGLCIKQLLDGDNLKVLYTNVAEIK